MSNHSMKIQIRKHVLPLENVFKCCVKWYFPIRMKIHANFNFHSKVAFLPHSIGTKRKTLYAYVMEINSSSKKHDSCMEKQF